jgi:hypothetical protein
MKKKVSIDGFILFYKKIWYYFFIRQVRPNVGGMTMAHLIKLEDYVSRYQSDLHRYPSKFTRMKKERWNYIKQEWEQLQSKVKSTLKIDSDEDEFIEKEGNLFTLAVAKMKNWKSRKYKKEDIVVENEELNADLTIDELRKQFLDDLFHSQLRWASSSLLEESSLHPRYKKDTILRFFSQQLPDNFFLMYRPVFYIRNAPIELDIILITPNEVICLAVLNGDEHSVFEASSDRFWTEYVNQTRKKRISPLLALSRMSGVIQPILEEADIQVPIRKVVFTSNGMIDHRIGGTKTELIDHRNVEGWHQKLKKNPTPIKHQQLKIAEILLAQTHTMGFKRMQEDLADS